MIFRRQILSNDSVSRFFRRISHISEKLSSDGTPFEASHMDLILNTLKEEQRKCPGLKFYLHIQLFSGRHPKVACPCGRNIEVSSRLTSKRGAISRREATVKHMRKLLARWENIVIKNRNRSANYPPTSSEYLLIAHICDLKKYVN